MGTQEVYFDDFKVTPYGARLRCENAVAIMAPYGASLLRSYGAAPVARSGECIS